MQVFFLGLDVFERVLFIIATTSTALLIVQIILLLIGIGGSSDMIDFSHVDVDAHFDTHLDTGAEFSLFTIKGVIGFFAVGGWVGFAVSQAGGHILLVILLTLITGTATLFGVAYLYNLIVKMQSDGTINMSNAVGLIGKVYLTIPPKGKGSGKVNLTIQERLIEAEAISQIEEPIKTEEMIRVIGCYENTVIVEKYS